MADYTCKYGQTERPLILTVEGGGLTGATGTQAVLRNLKTGEVLNLALSVTDDTTLTHAFDDADWDPDAAPPMRAGRYAAYLEGTLTDEGLLRVPDEGYLTVEIQGVFA